MIHCVRKMVMRNEMDNKIRFFILDFVGITLRLSLSLSLSHSFDIKKWWLSF